jgi:hypothetical protein
MYCAKLAGRNRVEMATADEAATFFPTPCGAQEQLAAQPDDSAANS